MILSESGPEYGPKHVAVFNKAKVNTVTSD
jgi:hypothetical protein